jgi:hypothetical protein
LATRQQVAGAEDVAFPGLDRSAKPARRTGGQTAALDESAVVQWMRDLNDPATSTRELAEKELGKCGFGTVHLELARKLTSSDARLRANLADVLPRVSGIDARKWLLWLSRDEDADVRLAALGVMATAADPELLHRVAEMAHDDSDQRIQEQGQRIQTSNKDLASGEGNRRDLLK